MEKQEYIPNRHNAQVNLSTIPNWIWMWFGALIVLLVWGIITTQILPIFTSNAGTSDLTRYELIAPGWASQPIPKMVLSPWLRWDTLWYLLIAKYGYSLNQASLAFPPLYPFVTRLFGLALGGQYLLGALLVSWCSNFGACFLLVDLIKLENFQISESRVIQIMLFFPTAFFFFAGYTESLFLLLTLLGWRLARRGDWGWVGLISALAILTRFIGVFLFLPYLWIFWEQFKAGKTRWFTVFWLGLMPAAYLGWNWYSDYVYGITASQAMHINWAQYFGWPWIGLFGSIKSILFRPISEVYFAYIDVLVIGLSVAATRFCLLKKKLPEGLFLFGALMISLVKITDQGLLGSVSRFMITIFPLYFYLSKAIHNPITNRLALYISIALWLMSSAMFFTWNWIA